MNIISEHISEHILEHLLEVTNDSVVIIDPEGKVFYWNDVAAKTYGIDREEIIGESIDRFFHEDRLKVLETLRTGKAFKDVYHQPRENEHVLINTTPVLGPEQQLIAAIAVEKDISQIVQLNDELSQTSIQLSQLKNEGYLQRENAFAKIKGHSSTIQNIIQMARKVAQTDATIYLNGESGVGKELFAQAIHEASTRNDHPFIPINCGAIPESLFESELFGYESGAFTGATKKGKKGKLELAHQGTIFLDEIGELPLSAQVKLLRVLQEKVVYRVGGTKPIPLDIRIVSASNRDLEKMVKEGDFREDLYYRLNVVHLMIPPLRKRLKDIPDLVQMFFTEFAATYNCPVPSITTNAMSLLLQYHWPGNIRELRNVIERLVIFYEGKQIEEDDLLKISPQLHNCSNAVTASAAEQEGADQPEHDALHRSRNLSHVSTYASSSPLKWRDEQQSLEKAHIQQALKETYGNKSAAAKILGISRTGLYKKMKKYHLS